MGRTGVYKGNSQAACRCALVQVCRYCLLFAVRCSLLFAVCRLLSHCFVVRCSLSAVCRLLSAVCLSVCPLFDVASRVE